MTLQPKVRHENVTSSAHLRQEYMIVSGDNTQQEAGTKFFPSFSKFGRYGKSHGHWLPLSLELSVLALFLLVLLCLLASLLVIRHYATQHDGLKLVTTNHYTWTYGPTAVFIIVISFWRLVDYHCKALIPWAELERGPVAADRSIFLDHVSPFLLVTVAAAGRKHHFVVVLTIFGFLLLKMVTVASTGLFFPANATVGPIDVDMVQTSQFDVLTNFSDYSDPGASPFYTTYAILRRGYPLPEGLTENMLYEAVRPLNSSKSLNTTYIAKSQAFVPQVMCELVDTEPLIHYDEFTSTIVSQYEQLQVQNSSRWSCPPQSGLTADGVTVQAINVAAQICPPRQLFPSFGVLECNRTDNSGNFSTHPFLVGVSDIRYSQTFNVSIANYSIGDGLEPQSWEFQIPRITAMLCSIDYSIQDVQVTYNLSRTGNPVQRVDALGFSKNETLPNISNDFLMRKLSYANPTSAGGARDMFGLAVDYNYVEQRPNTVLTMVAEIVGGDYVYLLDHPQDFLQATQHVLNTMLLQIGKENIMIPDTNETFRVSPIVGQQTYTEQRLEVQFASLIAVIAGLSVMVLVVVAVVVLRPKPPTRENPEALIDLANTLRNSSDFHKYLAQLACLDEIPSSQILHHAMYQTLSAPRGTILRQIWSREAFPVTGGSPQSRFLHYYAPLTMTKAFLGLTLFSALLAIAVLEVLQHLSDSPSHGIAIVQDPSTFNVSVYTRFLPALVALLIATMFNCLDFNIAMLAPFDKMRAQPASYSDLNRPLLAQFPPVALFTALRRGYWPALCTGIGAMVGSVLTIVVSALFTIEYVPDVTNMPVTPLDSWNLSSHQGYSTDNAAAAVSSLVESANLSYPSFTFDELVFPSLRLETSSRTTSGGLLTAQIPALRAELVCEELPWQSVNYTIGWNQRFGSTEISFNGSVPLPEHCHFGSSYGNESFITLTMSSEGFNSNTNDSYFAKALEIHVGPWSEHIQFFDSGTAPRDQPDNAPGCPSLVLSYGYFNGGTPSKSTWTSLMCYQKLQQLTTNLTCAVPSTEILPDLPPIPDEATAQYMFSGPSNQTAFWWHLQANLEYPFKILNTSAVPTYLIENDDLSDPTFSNFFRGAFFGKTPLPLETLQRNDTDTRELIFDHIQKFYRRYMAQYISANLRVPANGSATAAIAKRDDIIIDVDDIQGSFTPTVGTPRLVQHRTPKIVMQIMLAIMFVCGALALWLGRYHDLVLWNPCTIAGVMVLFAGSTMCAGDLSSSNTTGKTGVGGIVLDHDREETTYHDFEQDITSYVMTELSRLGNTSNRNLGQGQDADMESERALIEQDSGNASSTAVDPHAPGLKNGQARFRLGWWMNGEYIGSRKGTGMDTRDDSNWRYGIDVL